MSKLAGLKDKVSQLKTQLSEKLDSIALVKRWREGQTTKATQGPDPLSIGSIYRDGGVGTRLQVLLMFTFALGSVAATAYVGQKMWKRLRTSKAHEELKKDYSHGLEELSNRVKEHASMVSLGKFTVNSVGPRGEDVMLSLDIWLKVSDAETAAFVQKNDTLVNDRVTDALDAARSKKFDALTPEGKDRIKGVIIEHLTPTLPKGKVEEVYFHNLMVQ